MGTKKKQKGLQDLEQELKSLRSELKLYKKNASVIRSLEKSYKETKELLDSITDNVFDSIIIIDFKGNILYANDAAFRMVDLDSSIGIEGKTVYDFIVPDQHPDVSQNLNLVRDGTHGVTTIYRITTATGRECWIEAIGKKIFFRGTDADLITLRDITEHKSFEEDLRKRQALMDSIFRAVPTGIGIISNRIIIDVNDRICEMTGYRKDELLGKSGVVFYPEEEEFARAREEKDRLLMEMGIGSVETKWKRKDGTIIDVFMRFSPLLPGDTSQGVTFTALDITKRKQIDNILRDSEERYRRITSAITDYIYTVYLFGGKPARTVHSQACVAVTGYEPREFDENSYLWFTMIFEQDRDLVHNHIDIVLSNRDPGPIEHRIARKDGTVIWVSNTPVLHRDEEGALVSYDGVVSDITKRKQAEIELKESEIRFRILHEASFGGIGIHDKGLILDCNQGLADITGYSMVELIGMDGLNLIAPDYRDMVMQNIITGYEKTYDAEGIRKDGTTYPLEIRGKSLPYKGKNVRVTEFRDITDRKRAEDALRSSEERFRSLIQSSSDIIVILNSDGACVYETPSVSRILGYEPGSLIGRKPHEFIHPDDLAYTLKELQEVYENTNTQQPTKMRFRRSDNSWVFL